MIICDMSSLSQVRDGAEQVLNQFGGVDYLINCAGANIAERVVTEDGLEANFAVNYLGPFLLTELLLERIQQSRQARIIHVTSATQEVGKLNFDDLQLTNGWSMLASYAQAKLCLIIHASDLAHRLSGSTATINSLNPGYIKTNLTRHTKGLERLFVKLFGRLAAPTWVGAERIVSAALQGDSIAVSGSFIYEDIVLTPNPQALVDANVKQLMSMSKELTELTTEAEGE